MSSNASGFQNEHDIIHALNGRRYKELNPNLKKFIQFIEPKVQEDTVIKSEKAAHVNGINAKGDISITFNQKTVNVSIKKGTGNSVHQEQLQPFIRFLERDIGLTPEEYKDLSFFVWGDLTLDGTGRVQDRMDNSQLRRDYPEVVQNIKALFTKHLVPLLERVLFTGGLPEGQADIIYYGNAETGVWASREEILKYMKHIHSTSGSFIKLGNLTFQVWNRSLKGTQEKKRENGDIQFKWGAIEASLNEIRNGDV